MRLVLAEMLSSEELTAWEAGRAARLQSYDQSRGVAEHAAL